MPCIRCQSPAIFARFHCKPCWQTLHPGQQEPDQADPWHQRKAACVRCREVRWIQSQGHCRACWLNHRPGKEQVPRKRIAAPKRHHACVRCGEVRRIRAQGHCRPCWLSLHPELKESERLSYMRQRERETFFRQKPAPIRPDQPRRLLGEPVPTVGGVPLFTVSRNGIPLATLHDPDAADRERERRVAIYTRMVEQYGEIRWGQLPPPEDDLDDAVPGWAEPPLDDVPAEEE